jgi:oligopeptidase B
VLLGLLRRALDPGGVMNDRRELLASLGALAAAQALPTGARAADGMRWPAPPQPRREPQVVGNYGHRRIDDYAWLRPKDWHAVLADPSTLDPPIRAAVLAENAYTDAMMAPTAPLQATLAARAEAIETADHVPLAVQDGDWLYYERTGVDRPVYCRRPVAGGGAEQVLLDVAAEAAGKTFYALLWTGPLHSPDGTLFGWSADETGSGIFGIRVRDIASGRMLVDDIEGVHGEFAFAPGGRYLYYVGRSDKGWPDSVWRRDMVGGGSVKILDQCDPGFFVSVRATASGGFVVIRLFNGDASECHVVPGDDPTAAPRLVEPRRSGTSYDVDHWHDRLVILTDADGARDFMLMTAPVATPGKAYWTPLVPHEAGRFISAIHPFATHLVREEWRDAKPRLVVMAPDGREHDIAFGEPAYAIGVPAGQGFANTAVTYRYQSPRLPARPYRLPFATAVPEPASPTFANPSYDPARYVVERIEAVAADGARVPITILTARDAVRDGRRPLLLYGYGSYGASVECDFSAAAIALVDQGWSYAIAHVRGGGERGSDWWHSVLGHGKPTTFTDFTACAEHLIAARYTAPRRIVAHGYSAGGLLMGAIYWMRPDLWAGVIAQVPFVDVVNTMDAFESHPLGRTALPIWGDPRVPADYASMLGYSPYDNLRAADYPALLATGSVADDRVSFWEPVKFAVKARALTTGHDPIMVTINMAAGHMGSAGSIAAREQTAMFHAFAIWAVDRTWGRVPQR